MRAAGKRDEPCNGGSRSRRSYAASAERRSHGGVWRKAGHRTHPRQNERAPAEEEGVEEQGRAACGVAGRCLPAQSHGQAHHAREKEHSGDSHLGSRRLSGPRQADQRRRAAWRTGRRPLTPPRRCSSGRLRGGPASTTSTRRRRQPPQSSTRRHRATLSSLAPRRAGRTAESRFSCSPRPSAGR
eukprot:scaffold14497_cov116-Isochrysis_galbana.AAC.6